VLELELPDDPCVPLPRLPGVVAPWPEFIVEPAGEPTELALVLLLAVLLLRLLDRSAGAVELALAVVSAVEVLPDSAVPLSVFVLEQPAKASPAANKVIYFFINAIPPLPVTLISRKKAPNNQKSA
jgi:hypothetical protein